MHGKHCQMLLVKMWRNGLWYIEKWSLIQIEQHRCSSLQALPSHVKDAHILQLTGGRVSCAKAANSKHSPAPEKTALAASLIRVCGDKSQGCSPYLQSAHTHAHTHAGLRAHSCMQILDLKVQTSCAASPHEASWSSCSMQGCFSPVHSCKHLLPKPIAHPCEYLTVKQKRWNLHSQNCPNKAKKLGEGRKNKYFLVVPGRRSSRYPRSK
eukprot:1160029-Pelagomonas_calceolata.AAC.2